jgi:signal transduction histidine kinase/ligand-binding sensor domain-containing protein/CheY-like chemotaxis protein
MIGGKYFNCLLTNLLNAKCCSTMKSKLLVFALLLSIGVLYASNKKFYSINSKYGVFLRESASICGDQNGFIWASSKTGMLRLSEGDYRLYKLPYEKTGYFVKALYRNSALYAYANNGEVFEYNEIKDKFEQIFNLRKWKKNNFANVHNIEVDNRGTFWIATTSGLYKYWKGKLLFVKAKLGNIAYIAWYDNKRLLVADNQGVSMVDVEKMKVSRLINNSLLNSSQISKLYYDKLRNTLWIGTVSNGLYRYDFRAKSLLLTKISAFPKQPVRAIEANTDSTMLIGIDGQGIWEIDRKNANKVINVYKEDADDSHSLRGDGVYDIFCAPDKRVWIGTYSGGVSYFDQKPPFVREISHYVNKKNSLSNNYINKIIEDKNGNVWFATNNGISKWNVSSDTWSTYYHNKEEQAQVFLALCEDNKGRIWAGTYSSGVYVLEGSSGREIAHYSQHSKDSFQVYDDVFDIFKDSEGDIWIGSPYGGNIKCFLSKENKFRTYFGLPVNVFAELSPGKILLACSYSLCVLDKRSGNIKDLCTGHFVQDITVYGGKVWMGTRGDGMVCCDLDRSKMNSFTMSAGLPSNFVNGIEKAGGYLWLGTEDGLCKFDPKTKQIVNYSSLLSSLSHVSFNPDAHCLRKNGDLLWGTNDGVLSFNPAKIRDTFSKKNIYFQDLAVSGRSIKDNPTIKLTTPLDKLKELTLNYNQNTLTLEVLPLGTNTLDSKFSWKMEGLDAEWSQPVAQHFITYTNLPSGTYVLKVRLYDSSFSYVIAEREIKIHIIPPVWKRWWFFILLALLIGGVIYLLLRYYSNRIKQQQAEAKIKFFANTAHDIRTSLTLINAPIEEIRKEGGLSDVGNYYLSLAIEQAKRLSKVITQLMDFQKADVGKEQALMQMVDIVKMVSLQKLMFDSHAKSKNIELIFNSTQESYWSGVDEVMMEKVVSNLISNAIKYSHTDSQVYINLLCVPESWTLEVIDRGIGISPIAQQKLFHEFYRGDNALDSKIEGSGIGLLIAKKYVMMHNGTISCESQENAGSCFRVVMPYKRIDSKLKSSDLFDDLSDIQHDENGYSLVAQNPEKQTTKMKILLVEDNDDLRKFMTITLASEFEVSVAEDGKQAWDIIQEKMPELVVSDVMMPNMDGFELCRLIKQTYETSHIPVILLTALSEQEPQMRGLGLGADEYLTKPFDMNLLFQRIRSIIHNREVVREKYLKLNKYERDDVIFVNENNDKFVKTALSVVHENMSFSDFGKDEFAAALNVSSSLLYKKIKALTGQSPTDFIKTIRLNYALELLEKRKYSVTEISEFCGFASVGYFSTVFRKYFGKSPTEI